MSTTIRDLALATLNAQARQQQEEQRQKDEAERTQQHQQVQAMEGVLREELGDLHDDLGIIYRWSQFASGIQHEAIAWIVMIEGLDVSIRLRAGPRSSGGRPRSEEPEYHFVIACSQAMALREHVFANPGELRERLLLTLGHLYAWIEQQAERQAEQERNRAEMEAARQAEQARQEQERQQLLQEHHACTEVIRAAVRQRGVWTWPVGASLTLYQLRWYVGHDEDGQPAYEYAWAADEAQPDADGYYTLHCASRSGTCRTFKIDPAIHLPIWEQHTYTSSSDLPRWATNPVQYVEVDGIGHMYSPAAGQHIYFWEAGSTERVQVRAPAPIGWVRALLGEHITYDVPDAWIILAGTDDDDLPF